MIEAAPSREVVTAGSHGSAATRPKTPSIATCPLWHFQPPARPHLGARPITIDAAPPGWDPRRSVPEISNAVPMPM